ncbi:MAG: hypothetical protein IPN08_05730 [Bacteroidales bacterium]|nr:hypothetical protein [Bacteroidales bacterium]MBK9356874.1 hypothetical protein [Bacteroidales bacterium]
MNSGTSDSAEHILTDERWIRAAVAGGLWAAVEIIIGSFLHNLRIPFAGSILSAFAVMLMISFHRLWPLRGLIWRAGLICALMKSVSPSALILGPMIGIMSEALLLELSLRIFGFNRTGYITGGILGVGSALVHKVVSILILYGTDIIEVYLNIYRFAVKQVGMPDADPWLVVIALVGVYFLVGIAAAVTGISIPLNNQVLLPGKEDVVNGYSGSPFIVSARSFSLTLLSLHLVSLPLLIFIILKTGLPTGAIAVMAWAALVYLKYPGVFRRFRKPVLWVQFLIIILIAAFFWERDCNFILCFSYEGFNAGLTMTLRALVVIMAFSAIGYELRNPVVRLFLEKRGLRNLYLAITVAFSALPYMVAQIPDAGKLIRHPGTAIAGALTSARIWLAHFERNNDGSGSSSISEN